MTEETRRRLTREETREQTRQRLIESARRQVAARGFNGASVRDIAEGAGYSQGAFYSNFDSKEALLLEVLKLYKLEEAGRINSIIEAAGDDLTAALDGLDARAERLAAGTEHAVVSAELQLHAVRNSEFGRAYWLLMEEQRALYAEFARRLFALSNVPPPAALEDLAGGLMSLGRGAILDSAIHKGAGVNLMSNILRALLHQPR
ncbi:MULTISPECIES: TetR/AcrR family transcriptional regulator [Agrobacterium]|uniref:TetR/AcrR family transcriptional regulator n=1 Tax=Agrobacterium tumefaciens TaxID=358 RepID=A0AAE6EIB4_AGRTU|nr:MULTISPECIES: TetR/AcrR family transcriptional regulator [Agrobacterium]QCL77029.1 TetR/AcrR family transcriptional regulator [Agrobacterium tumefaciens]QCL82536.1 TetR/AcrR family transcriptional regulator [Agrobacterium tumefaciens]CUX71036.1 Regulatory protein TetR [Agrobacterium sp. NCPPB 925]